MNKKGFTLIELLAVIVILAIIALITTPIVLNIISDSKEQTELRNAEFYLSALELSIANSTLDEQKILDGTYNILKNGNVCLEVGVASNCSIDKILPVEVKGKVPTSGTITIKSGQLKDVSLNLNNKIIGKNENDELVYYDTLTDICKLVSGNAKTAGAKYECKIKADTKYNFYVLTTPESTDTTINLILDQNINSDGTLAGLLGATKNGDNVYNLVAWNSSGLNTGGPVDAMEFLYNATKDWTNVPALNYIYNDKDFQETKIENTSYISFVSKNGVAVINSLTGQTVTIGSNEEPLRARMPIYSATYSGYTKISEKGEILDGIEYFYDNLDINGIQWNSRTLWILDFIYIWWS